MVNLTALAAATAAIKIIDFQGRALDLTDGGSGSFVPIQCFSAEETPNQRWFLQSIDYSIGHVGPYQIVNEAQRNLLSYPSALAPEGVIVRQQAMAHENVRTTWFLVPTAESVQSRHNIILANSQELALTSWSGDIRGLDRTNPLTLEPLLPYSPRQQFTIKTLD